MDEGTKLLELTDIEYFLPTRRQLYYYNERDSDLICRIQFVGHYFLDNIKFEKQPNIKLPDGTFHHCESMISATYGHLDISDMGSNYINRQLNREDARPAIGVIRCHDWIDAQIERDRIRNDFLEILLRLDPYKPKITFQFGVASEVASALPIDGFSLEFSGAAP